jgi:TPP-dependent pyruvate/acetoin dehydrogenase alpha subunit
VPRQRQQLLDAGVSNEVLDEIEQRAAADVNEAAEWAMAAAPPDPQELGDDVYAERVVL